MDSIITESILIESEHDSDTIKSDAGLESSVAEKKKENDAKKCAADADALYKELQKHYRKLKKFKSSASFKTYGFAIGGPHNDWLIKVQKLRDDERNLCCLINHECTAGDLENLGLSYVSSEGKDDEYTRWASALFE